MLPKLNYQESIVSLSNSIRRHYGCKVYHNTLPAVDEALCSNPKNVILLVLDGFGQAQVEAYLKPKAFLRMQRKQSISSVFLPTTVAAISAIQTGLTPAESGWLGWCQYFDELDRVVDMFSGRDSERENNYFHNPNPAPTLLPKHYIWDAVTESGQAQGHCLMNFGKGHYNGSRDMVRRLLKLCRQPGNQFVYCYNNEPDYTLHKCGKSRKSRRKVRNLNRACARLTRKMRNTLLIVTADHGHADVTEPYSIDEFPALAETLRCGVDLEPRALGCRVKEGRDADFLREARKAFGEEIEILSKGELIKGGFFGNTENSDVSISHNRLPDYLLLPPPGMCIYHRTKDKTKHKSLHGGSDSLEMIVPLIIAER